MFCCLRLRAVYIRCNQEHGCIHNCCSSQHCRQEDIVARAIAKRYVADQFKSLFTTFICALGIIFFAAWIRLIALRGITFRALIYFGICITETNSDIPDLLLPKPDSFHPRNSLDNGGFAVCDVANGANVESSLATDNLWWDSIKMGNILIVLWFECRFVVECLYFFLGK